MSSDNLSIPLFRGEDRIAVAAAAKKGLLYLDSNIWIHIAEKHHDVAEQCRRAVHLGKVLFPVSYPTISEVLEQPDSLQRSGVATLMDDLSRGFSFRNVEDIRLLELDLAISKVVLSNADALISRGDVLCPVVEYTGRSALDFPPGWKQEDAEEFTELVAMRPELRSVRWLMDHLPMDEMRAKHAKSKSNYVHVMSAGIAESVAHFRNLPKDKRRRRLLLEERTWVVKRLLSPRLNQMLLSAVGPDRMPAAIARLQQHMGEGSEERLEQTMKAMPSLDLYCHIMAERTSNYTRKVQEQDFHDVEHAIVGAAYADAFVTEDRHLLALLARCSDIPAVCGCQLVRGVEGLRAVLSGIMGQDACFTFRKCR